MSCAGFYQIKDVTAHHKWAVFIAEDWVSWNEGVESEVRLQRDCEFYRHPIGISFSPYMSTMISDYALTDEALGVFS